MRREQRRLQLLALAGQLAGLALLEQIRTLDRDRDHAGQRVERARLDRAPGGRENPDRLRARHAAARGGRSGRRPSSSDGRRTCGRARRTRATSGRPQTPSSARAGPVRRSGRRLRRCPTRRSRGTATAANARSNRRATVRARTESASGLSVIISTSRLRSNRRASSSRRPTASSVRARATADRLLATRLTARKAKSATQFCGSAIVKVPTGGRKKKFRHSMATTDVTTAIARRDVAATTSTTIR